MSTNPPAQRPYADVSIVVPALNEAGQVRAVLAAMAAAFPGAEVLLVDNGSTDDTAAIAREVERHSPDVRVLVVPRRGKGYAMQVGAVEATRPLLMFQDADLEYRVEDAQPMVEAVRASSRKMAVGVRSASFGATPWSSLMANATIRRLLAWRFGRAALRGADILCGTRVLTREAFLAMKVTAGDFRVETQVTRKALAHGLQLTHLPVHYTPRSRSEGKKIRPRHLLGLMREALFSRG